MLKSEKKSAHRRLSWVYSTRLHLVMFSFLLVATPFLMIQRYLQEAIGRFSSWSVEPAGVEIVVVPVTVAILVLAAVITWRRHITRLRVLAAVVAVALIALAQQIADYYFHHNFYDLQQNWHYIAYGIFAFMMYRDLSHRDISLARIILVTFLVAALYSSFDEAFQMRISSRVFDLGDIAKDVWGSIIGMSLLYLGENPHGALLKSLRPVRHRRLRGYIDHPFSILLLCAVLTLIFLIYGSHLSEPRFGLPVMLFTLGTFIAFFLALHCSQFRWGRRTLLTIFILAAGLQSYFFIKYRNDYIVYNRPGLTVYKGIPICYFDIMIFPNGRIRIVDKKSYFYARDRMALMRQRADIVIVSSGPNGNGGRGFPKEDVHQFNYNAFLESATQVIIRRTPEACRLFNKLKRERKNVLLVLHNTD